MLFVSLLTPFDPYQEDDGLELGSGSSGSGGVGGGGSGGIRGSGMGPPVPIITHHSIMYAPKCLVLISRLDYFETFRVSGSIFFTKAAPL